MMWSCKIKKKDMAKSFFQSVAKHNLERFHSECLCWLFKEEEELARAFVSYVLDPKSQKPQVKIEIGEIEAEKNQIDIEINFSILGDSTKYKILIENKIKAAEHYMSRKQLEKSLKKTTATNIDSIDHLSQTEFYYLREDLKKEENTKIFYVFLTPIRIQKKNQNIDYNYECLNDFRSGFIGVDGSVITNPWLTITYPEMTAILLNALSGKDSKSISVQYVNYLKEEFNEVFVDESHFNNLIFSSINKNDAEVAEQNKYGYFEYYKLFWSLVKSKLQTPAKELAERVKVASGSSNSGSPLFTLEIIKNAGSMGSVKMKNSLKEEPFDIVLGVQLQGGKLKLYTSASQYDVIMFYNIIDGDKLKADYKEKAQEILSTTLDKVNKLDSRFSKEMFSESTNKNRTFFSRSTELHSLNPGNTLESAAQLVANFIDAVYQSGKTE